MDIIILYNFIFQNTLFKILYKLNKKFKFIQFKIIIGKLLSLIIKINFEVYKIDFWKANKKFT